MWIQAALSILPNIIGKVADGFKHRREIKNAVQVKKLDLIEKKEMVDANWEKDMAGASKDSWKDEFWTLIFGYLLLSPIWAPGQMTKVFAAYAEAPDWFQLCVLVSVGASFGVKVWKNLPWSK